MWLVSSEWVTSETVVSGFPGETVIVRIAEFVFVPEWVTARAVASGSCVESVIVLKVVLDLCSRSSDQRSHNIWYTRGDSCSWNG